MYAMMLMRYDISHAVRIVNKYIASLIRKHWKTIKWIMKYLRGTLSYGLVYGKKK